ncbi:hypothetical protein KRP22_002766 [Phytophthora ramorum]|nr:hypothetical protein KRP22_6413 [Phytophthora ramorum]
MAGWHPVEAEGVPTIGRHRADNSDTFELSTWQLMEMQVQFKLKGLECEGSCPRLPSAHACSEELLWSFRESNESERRRQTRICREKAKRTVQTASSLLETGSRRPQATVPALLVRFPVLLASVDCIRFGLERSSWS